MWVVILAMNEITRETSEGNQLVKVDLRKTG